MKLYKDGKCMQMVDKDQVDICLDAGWSRIDKVAVTKAKEETELAELQALKDAEALLAGVKEGKVPETPKKIVRKSLKKK